MTSSKCGSKEKRRRKKRNDSCIGNVPLFIGRPQAKIIEKEYVWERSKNKVNKMTAPVFVKMNAFGILVLIVFLYACILFIK